MIYYGKNNKNHYGFHIKGINLIKEDFIEISEEKYQKLLLGESIGLSIKEKDGEPILCDGDEEIVLDNLMNYKVKKKKIDKKEQARTELTWIYQESNLASSLNKKFSDEMIEFYNIIKDIIDNEKDIDLPKRPENIFK